MDGDSLAFNNSSVREFSVGKQPAWLDYMTNYDKTYGNFAANNSESFMVLNRVYETKWEGNNPTINSSTYIDPQAYNYVFPVTIARELIRVI